MPVPVPVVSPEHRKTVTALFCDLVGSTALQESLDPETGRQIMRRYYDVAEGVVARFGGTVDGFAGDGLCAVWGVPDVAEDDALRAVRAAQALVDGVVAINAGLQRDFGVELLTRTGLNTGEVVVAADRRLVGDVMNTAARLESAAPVGGVLIGEATWRLVRSQVTTAESGLVVAKGKREPVRAFRLLSLEPPRATAVASYAGRDSERRRLADVWDDVVASGACRLASVIGAPGIGKSRLAGQVAIEVERHGGRVIATGCEVSSEAATWLPVADLLSQVLSLKEGAPAATVLDRLREEVTGLADSERLVVLVGGVLGIGDIAPSDETFWAIREVLAAVARRAPLLVVIDDVQWATAQLLDLVDHLASWFRDASVMLLILARPELREVRPALTVAGGAVSVVVDLEPLDDKSARQLVRGLLGEVDVTPDVAARVLRSTGGNPLYLSELLRMLIDDETLLRDGDTWILAPGAVVEVPPTVDALISARLERLAPNEREVVERAAVIGRQFYRGAVAHLLTPTGTRVVDDELDALRRRELVEPDGTLWTDEQVYRFHHVLIRDAAYRALLKVTRATLHERFAGWLETKLGDQLGDQEEVVAFHLEQAHLYRRQIGGADAADSVLGQRAADLLASAGRRALAREDAGAAANLLLRADACAPGPDPELLIDLSDALLTDGRIQEAAEVIDRLDTEAAVDAATRALADLARAQLDVVVGADAIRQDALARAVEHFRASGDHRRLACGIELVGVIEIGRGRYAAAEVALTEALGAARTGGDKRRVARVLARSPLAALWGPSSTPVAIGRCMDVHRMVGQMGGNAPVTAQTWRVQALLVAMRSQWTAAEELLGQAREVFVELGLVHDLALTDIVTAEVALLRKRPAAAAEAAQRALSTLGGLGVDVSDAISTLARALLALGRPDEAFTLALELPDDASLHAVVAARSVRAEVLGSRGDLDQALKLALKTVDLADSSDALVEVGAAAECLASVRALAGDRFGAAAALAKAHTAYAIKMHEVGAARTASAAPIADTTVTAGQHGPMSVEKVPVLQRLVEAVNARDLDAVEGLYAEDFVLIDTRSVGWEETHGPDGARLIFSSWIEVVADAQWSTESFGEVAGFATAVFGGRGTVGGEIGEVFTGQVLRLGDDGRIARIWMTDPDRDAVHALARSLAGISRSTPGSTTGAIDSE